MDKIEDVSIEPCTNSRFIQPYRMKYKQDGNQRFWDCIKIHDSVAILIFNKTRKAFVMVRQFRPAVYMTRHRPLWENSDVFTASLSQKPGSTDADAVPPEKRAKTAESTAAATNDTPLEYGSGALGCTYELCAGIVDKKASLEQIAREEILEETGYDVSLESIQSITSYYSSLGTAGTSQSLFYCEVTDDMVVAQGGGNDYEGEIIEVIHMPLEEAMKLPFDVGKARPTALCFALLWFDKFKRPQLKD